MSDSKPPQTVLEKRAAAQKWRLKRSAELEEFPESELGVPLFHEMSHQQKLRFLNLMGVTEHKLQTT